MNRKHASTGFTLIEMLMSLTIIVILMCVSLPSMATLLGSNQGRSAKQELVSSITSARAHAIHTGRRTVACPSTNQTGCTGGLRWDRGWIVFFDSNGNDKRDADEALIFVANTVRDDVVITSTAGRERISFRADGSSAGSNVTLTVCDRRGSASASSVVLNNPGRVRTGAATAQAAAQTCALLPQHG